MRVESVRGMRDILPEEARLWQDLEDEIRRTFSLYGYKEIRLPLVELAELFSRGVGEATDIVHKEMYVFPDKKGQILALRPGPPPRWPGPTSSTASTPKATS